MESLTPLIQGIKELEAEVKRLKAENAVLTTGSIDILDLAKAGIPNIYHGCALSMKDTDERHEQWKEARLSRGFDDTETWGLWDTIVSFALPRLIRYQEIANDILIRDKKLVKGIDEVIAAFRILKAEGNYPFDKEKAAIVDKGMKQFPKVFFSLWW